MTYKQANSIRELVSQLSKTWANDPFVCALDKVNTSEEPWSCHLFPREGCKGYTPELWAIALAIGGAGCGLVISESSYNRGTSKPDYVNTIWIR